MPEQPWTQELQPLVPPRLLWRRESLRECRWSNQAWRPELLWA